MPEPHHPPCHTPCRPPRRRLARALRRAGLPVLAGLLATAAQAQPVAAPPGAAAADAAASAASSASAASAPAPAVPAASAAAPPPPEPAPSGPPAFQGLPWGATEAQIAMRFGSRLQRLDCDAAARRDAAQRGELCEHPTVPRYEVAGVPFRLDLHLDAETRTLQKVTLSYTGDAPVTGYAADSRWGERHRVLRMLLTQRYGGPESTHVDNEAGAYTATARWRRGETLIDLRSLFTSVGGKAPAREHFQITYLPVTAGDAGKL